MEKGEIDLHKVPITALTTEARSLLSCLLDSHKVLLSETTRRPRDWRGLASLIDISSEVANSFETKDKTTRVLEHWVRHHNGDATIGVLLRHMQDIDRFDVFDDLMELMDKGKLIATQYRGQNQHPASPCVELAVFNSEQQSEILTYDDKIHRSPQFYHAYVLFAKEDREFVDELLTRMREKGLKLCTEEDFLPDHETIYTPVSRLISSDRCHRTILVYSPDFLNSPANNFFMNYAQAVGIEKKRPKIVPVMYRECQLPQQLTFYHKLYYDRPGQKPSYDFWTRLSFTLLVHQPILNGTTNGATNSATFSAVNITEVNSGSLTNGTLALPRGPRSTSEPGLERLSCESQPSVGAGSQGDKKKSRVKTFMNSLNIKKRKKKKELVNV